MLTACLQVQSVNPKVLTLFVGLTCLSNFDSGPLTKVKPNSLSIVLNPIMPKPNPKPTHMFIRSSHELKLKHNSYTKALTFKAFICFSTCQTCITWYRTLIYVILSQTSTWANQTGMSFTEPNVLMTSSTGATWDFAG